MTRSSSDASASEPRSVDALAAGGQPRESFFSAVGGLWKAHTYRLTWLQWVTDIILGLLFALTFGLPLDYDGGDGTTLTWLLLPSWVLFTVAMIIRRYAPWPSFLIVVLAALLKSVFAFGPHPQDVAIYLSIYAAVAYGSRALVISSAVYGVVAPTIIVALIPHWNPTSFSWESIATNVEGSRDAFLFAAALIWLLFVGAGVVAWLAGLLRRAHLRAQEVKNRAAIVELERIRAQEQLAAEQERTQIARDMHDVVAHSLAVVVAQADGARYAMKSNPDSAEAALGTISSTARSALVDVRGLLGQLRHSQEAGPEPGLEELPALYSRMRAAGLDLQLETRGEPRSLTTQAQGAVFRLVQESLTNVLKHGDATRPVVVRLSWGQVFEATILNSVAVPPHPRGEGGHGLVGMAERVGIAGGNVQAERLGAQFRVHAWLPIASPQGAAGAELDSDDTRSTTERHTF
ncbi:MULTISPECIES: sensor histidine kinase [unclassified Pseudoclavibacter]|uniref:sensor histidine kinase n=1 Tax=unclassified Pseudoclavibacter TaxID=2615177 RepID=UPI0012F1D941|nr:MULTISPECIES: histidine kinase [unclassified Pseudoclavibacter]MBF4458070.1 sensor histidine kinase [Pseudoclavibacter sp. VKM Ac-2867]VXB37376.1 Sensor histidine kinase [Pseudoclavibacter sp. 8L]